MGGFLMPLPDEITEHFVNDTKGYKEMLDRLWTSSCDKIYDEQSGPYPVSHGKKHVQIVLERLADLMYSFEGMTYREKFEIFAAAMIHDVGMIKMLPTGAYAEIAERCRDNHANFNLIRTIVDDSHCLEELIFKNGNRLTVSERARIILIASGHAGDNGITAQQKQKAVESQTEKNHLIKGMRILRLADYLDFGEDRLITSWKKHYWKDNQLRHLKQHRVLVIEVIPQNRQIRVDINDSLKENQNNTLKEDQFVIDKDNGKGGIPVHVSPIEIIAILRTVYEKLLPILNDFNEKADDGKQWRFEPLDERFFGIAWPLVSGVGLFQDVLKKQLERSEHLLPIDLMGHSLYGRFVNDEEQLNNLLIKHLQNGNIKMRILLLDPHIENQQMCEVYDAQRKTEPEEGRSILPLYDKAGHIIDNGDIVKTLNKLENDWKNKVGPRSSLEIRLTSKLMYMNLSRYGETIIVTPYSGSGLFSKSIGFLHEKRSVLNQSYIDEFESVWDSPHETRLYMHVDRSALPVNPVKRLIPNSSVTSHPLDYEKYFLNKYNERVIAVFNYVKNRKGVLPPPVEVEIQPSSSCNLRCSHCIGQNLPHRHEGTNKHLLSGDVDALLTWQSDIYAVERFRISGLIGDPLSKASTEFTLDFLGKSKNEEKHTVLFTNGLGIEESDFDRLLFANYIHVSLDAATSETFVQMKGARQNDFENITNKLQSLSTELRKPENNEKKVGIGFVVNEKNAAEVHAAISLAINKGVNFIRFKPDIRPNGAISWRTWREAQVVISKAQTEIKNGLDIIMTNVAWQHSRLPTSEYCWAQYFFASIAPTGKIHVCDHLTESNGETSIGDLLSGTGINELWTTAVKDKKFGRRTSHCQVCPPFNWHINKLLDQLYVLYKQYGEKQLTDWITEAVEYSGESVP